MPTGDRFTCAVCGEEWLLGTSHVCAACGDKVCGKCIVDGLCKACDEAETIAAGDGDDDFDWPMEGIG